MGGAIASSVAAIDFQVFAADPYYNPVGKSWVSQYNVCNTYLVWGVCAFTLFCVYACVYMHACLCLCVFVCKHAFRCVYTCLYVYTQAKVVKKTEEMLSELSPSSVVFWGVKPQMVDEAMTPEIGAMCANHINVSMITELSLSRMSEITKSNRNVRIMPNMAAKVGAALTAVCFGSGCSDSDKELVEKLLKSCGEIIEITEDKFTSYTSVAGCGPAYVYLFMEALADAAVMEGFARPLARQMAAQLCKGCGMMYFDEPKSFGEFKDAVCSPGGVTIAGVAALHEHGMPNAVIQAVKAAETRGHDLGVKTQKK